MSVLSAQEIVVARAGRRVVDGVSLTVEPGRAVVLLGPNGAGKSTIAQTLLGLVRPAAGSVALDGRPVAAWSPRARAARVAWLPQDGAPNEPLPAWEWVAAGRYRFGERDGSARRAAQAALEALDVGALADRPVTTLSGGERQRVALSALFAQQARLLLVDEPASHLDPAHQLETYRRLAARVRDGAGLLLITHDVSLLGQLECPVDVMGLRAGRKLFQLTAGAPELADGLRRLFDVPFAAVDVGGRTVHVPRAHEDAR